MSDAKNGQSPVSPAPQGRLKETERIVQGPGPGRGPFGGGMVGQKANTFKPSAKRLLGTMGPERIRVYAILALALCSVVLMSFGSASTRSSRWRCAAWC